MKILNYKSLNEQSVFDQARSASKATGISQGSMRTLVGANLRRDARIAKIPTVNAFRGLGFSFVTQQSYNDFLASSGGTSLDVYNQLNYTFAILYENDSCYLYPYSRQSLTLETMGFVTSYLKLDLKNRATGTQENIQQYFSQFNPIRSAENENNVKDYQLTILPNFDKINAKYAIPNEVKKLKDFAIPPEPMYISINSVSKEYVINTAYGQREEKYLSLSIEFIPTQVQGLSSGTVNSDPYKSFKAKFNGITEMRVRKEMTIKNRNAPQNISNIYKNMSVFSPKNSSSTFIIYTDKDINTYLTVNQQRIPCIIGLDFDDFYSAEMIVKDVN